ncbi:MAG TPA: hypothetical protein VGM69_17470 [Chloroflexota bacterium]|jgi:hypothetical protein
MDRAPEAPPGRSRLTGAIHSRWPPLVAALAIAAVYLVIPDQLMIGPSWLPLAVVVAGLVPIGAAQLRGHHRVARTFALGLTAALSVLVALSVLFLVTTLPRGTTQAGPLLVYATLIWLANTGVFALWYWEVDCGGPAARHVAYSCTDFAFPQLVVGGEAAEGWHPHFLDYLFLAFNTSTAFSPTDTMVLSHRAKALMMAQSLISLVVIAFLAARAVNTL